MFFFDWCFWEGYPKIENPQLFGWGFTNSEQRGQCGDLLSLSVHPPMSPSKGDYVRFADELRRGTGPGIEYRPETHAEGFFYF